MAAVLSDPVNPALVLAHARAWVGTPFVPQGDLRGAGADCIGFIRGLWGELTGNHVPPPPWRSDWALTAGEPIFDGLMQHVVPVLVDEAVAGHIITYRVGRKRAAHVAILTESGAIHAWETAGVKETTPFFGRQISSAWALPCASGCQTGPVTLTADDCLAVIYPDPAGPYAEITHMIDGTLLARTHHYKSTGAALGALAPIYAHIETME